ncbi:hypothetical protein FAZ69_08510 [Trinickia terrae]|uniref:Ribbon-helix-helix protein, CopG family n=1 Tax=Trinickia terrae TaxID=2571161 RepID=A0A4U1I9K7_9BURK|nr:hypothetical protein [Trinickia terrae]TKC90179.1 hypothetical protein FAZ69_08510 [Trinickia terrae]
MDQVARSGTSEEDRATGVSNDVGAEKVTVSVTVHPTDYSRMVDVARVSGIPKSEFMALAMHLGVCEVASLYGEDDRADDSGGT